MSQARDGWRGPGDPSRPRPRAGAAPKFTQNETICAAYLTRAVGPMIEPDGEPPDGWAEALSAYLHQLVECNETVNLVSRKSIDRVVEGQLIPSLAALRTIPPREPVRVLDVGSGGGFPAIPLAILRPAARIALVEATRKKCVFLEGVVRALPLPHATVYWARIETPTPELRAAAPFDVALARAAGHPEKLRKAVLSLLRAGGEFWAFASPSEEGAVPWPSAEQPRTALVRIARA